jgi:hypothetical protein
MRLLPPFSLALIATFAAMSGPAAAQARDDLELKITGVTFIEAPPGRDKNLTAFGASPSQEKVEVNAVAVSRSLQFVQETGGFMDKGEVKVTAIFPDKSSQAFGSAEVSGFPKFSADGRTRSFNLAINRLPDRPVSGLVFEGTVPLTVATGSSKAAQALDPQRPGAFKLGGVEIRQFKVEGNSLNIEGNDSLQRIKTLSFKLPSGQVVHGERGGWQRMNADYRQTWEFDAPLPKGELQAELYEGLRTVRQPVRLVVGRPW